jgi:hypothetical protein
MPVFGFLPFNPAGANGQAEPICWPRREGLLRRQNPAGVVFFPWARWVSAEGSGGRRTGLGRSAEARSEKKGTTACFGKQKALLPRPGIGLLIFSPTNLEMNLFYFIFHRRDHRAAWFVLCVLCVLGGKYC